MKKKENEAKVIIGEITTKPKKGERLKIWKDLSQMKKEGGLTITETSPVKDFKELAGNAYEVITEDGTWCYVNL